MLEKLPQDKVYVASANATHHNFTSQALVDLDVRPRIAIYVIKTSFKRVFRMLLVGMHCLNLIVFAVLYATLVSDYVQDSDFLCSHVSADSPSRDSDVTVYV